MVTRFLCKKAPGLFKTHTIMISIFTLLETNYSLKYIWDVQSCFMRLYHNISTKPSGIHPRLWNQITNRHLSAIWRVGQGNQNKCTLMLPRAVITVFSHKRLPQKPSAGSALIIRSRYNEPIRTPKDASRSNIDLKYRTPYTLCLWKHL